MTLEEYIRNIKLELTGGVLALEIPDETLKQVIQKTLQEIQRFIDVTEFITVPFASCIDYKKYNESVLPEGNKFKKISSVSRIYRTEGLNGDSAVSGMGQSVIDPMYVQSWMAFTNGGTMYNLNDYVLNYLSYNTLMQMRNTTSTDLSFKQDQQAGKLYINSGFDRPNMITIEYIPKFEDVSEIESDYWVDLIQRLAIAQTKVILGRIRSRYKQTNALWEQDGETMLAEGQEELKTLRELLRVNSQMIYPID